jgi:16S rRNA (cytosine967-C5)-methyltransferase
MLLSAYQLFFLERVPAFAAVNEAVEAIKQARGPKLAAFANAVLRKLAKEAEETKGPGLLLDAVAASLPRWMLSALSASLGDDGARAFVATALDPPPLGLRVNDMADRDACLARLTDAVPQARFELGRASPLAILARGGGKSEAWPGFDRSWTVQEEGSQLVALAVGARPGDQVLDACAGRGNKATLLARAVAPGGAVDVADVYPAKLTRLERQFRHAGVALRAAHAVDWTVGVGDVGTGYDRALVDAPCSGTGTLRRRPDLTLRREPEDLACLAALQAAIVLRVATRLRPAGRLVYAVCSVLRDEAEAVVDAVLAADPALSLVPFDGAAVAPLAHGRPTLRLVPHIHGTDGYFLASFERRGG